MDQRRLPPYASFAGVILALMKPVLNAPYGTQIRLFIECLPQTTCDSLLRDGEEYWLTQTFKQAARVSDVGMTFQLIPPIEVIIPTPEHSQLSSTRFFNILFDRKSYRCISQGAGSR